MPISTARIQEFVQKTTRLARHSGVAALLGLVSALLLVSGQGLDNARSSEITASVERNLEVKEAAATLPPSRVRAQSDGASQPTGDESFVPEAPKGSNRETKAAGLKPAQEEDWNPDDKSSARSGRRIVARPDGTETKSVAAAGSQRGDQAEEALPYVRAVEISSSPQGGRSGYGIGDLVSVVVTFSEPVAVTGTPILRLRVGEDAKQAIYESGAASSKLVFTYSVAEGDEDTNGVGIEANSLSLNRGTIKDSTDDIDAVLNHRAVAANAGHKVDGVKPELATAGGAVANGATLTLTYDEPLDGTSMPAASAFTVAGRSQSRTVSGVRVSGSTVELTVDPAVEQGETGTRVSYTVPTGMGASLIRDVPGNEALGLSSEAVTNETPDTIAPTVSTVEISSDPGSDRIYAPEDEIQATVTFSEPVDVERPPRLMMKVGDRDRPAGYLEGTGTTELVFGYEVVDGDEDTDGVSIEANRLSLNADPVLWYAMPAASWNEALPVGNGRLAGMVFGNTGRERIQLNEDTLWAGAPHQRDILGAHRHLPEIRRLLFAGRYVEAQAMVNRELIEGRVVRAYQTLGDLWIDLGTESQAGYRRELDLETGIARTEWTRDGVAFTREVFASAPHGVLVVRIEADTPGAITGTVELTRPVDATTTAAGTELVLEGRASHGGQQLGVRFQARLRAVAEGGSVVAEGASLRLSGADAVTLILAAATDYRGTAPGPDAVRQVEAAEATGYTALREAHVADHRAIFNRVWLELGGSEWRREPTDTRLRFVRSGGEDTDLEAMYFQFGRYLLMASSRPGTMPANLQGVWNGAVKPPWNSDYHININIQMIYWPADVANLSEMQEPLWDMLDRLRERGRATARDHYGVERGFVAHHTTDAWWWTSPVGSARYGMWPSGGAWLSRHMWEAYLFNRDAAFLRERAYPVLKEAAEFFLDWLVPEPGTDLLLSGPSISPENAFRINGRRTHVTMGPAMDQQIVRDLFENVLAAAAELGIDDAFTQETAAKLAKLAGPQVGTDGRLMEWRQEELVEADPGHRHISHAFGLYPGSQFTVRGTPDLAAAVRKSIEHRVANGGGGTGWSLGWLLNMWARLEAGGKAYSTLRRLLTDMTMDNLLDLHPLVAGARTNVFQMDGNLGGTAGIAEMLLQSYAGEIHLLPALPRQWSRGVVEGLKARGGFEVSMAWSDGALTTVSIRSRSGEECRVRVAGGEVRTLAVGMGETRWFDGQLSEVRAPQGLAAPRDVAVTGSTPTSLSLSVTWQPPLFEGRSVYGYDVQYAKRGESGFREWPHWGRAPGTTITGLERDAAWKVRVRARNASGPGAWSSAVEYTGDIVAPPPPPPPPPPVIDTIEITSDPGTDATYAAGDTIEVTATFDETVAVTRMPQLTLNVGGVDQAANYGSGTGAALVFAYPVADSDLDTDGVSIEANRLSLNGGTIKDGSNNNAVLDHGGLAADSGHKVDAVKPQLAATGGAVVDGTRLTLTYDEALDGGSRPVSGDFTVSGGDRVRAVTGVRVNGSAVELTLDVAAEHGEAGITVSYTPGTNPIQDVPGNDAEALSREPVINDTPDTTPPEVESLGVTSNSGSDQTYAAEDEIEVTVTFNETVKVEGTPWLTLRVGIRNRTAGYLRGTDTAALVFGYEVADGDEDTGGVSIEAGRIALNGGAIEDEAENAAELAHGAVAAQAGHKVDGVRPAFSSAAVDGSSLTLTYGEALDGGSRPASGDFRVEVDGSGRSVSGVSVSGSVVTLFLNPAVEHGDTGIRVSYTVPAEVGANPIQDEVGNEARGLSNRSVTNTTGAQNTDPEITSPSSFDVPENQLVARRLAARDADPGDEVTGWAVVGGADRFQFSIAPDTGELSFREAPDYESPADAASADPLNEAGDNQYVVRVEVTSGAGARELTAEKTFTIRVTDEREPPEVPEAPAISGETADSLEVSWSEPDNTGPPITGYDVQYREEGRGRFTDAQHEGPGLTLTLTDLEPGTVYEVQVRAKNDEGTGDWSDPGEGMTVTPLTVGMASGAEPPVSGPFTVRFSFSEPVTGFSRSDVETGQDPACRDDQNNTVFCDAGIGTLQTTDDRVFTATVTPWTDRVAHSYTLRLTVPGGGVRSSVGSKPNEEPEEPLEVRVAPPGVEEPISSIGLGASSGSGSVRLSWSRPSEDGGSAIIRYEVRYQAVGEAWSEWENVGAGSLGVTVGDLVNGREYIFEVRAVNALGKGGAETVQATPERRIAPPPPPPPPGGGGLLFPPEAPAGLMAMPGEGAVRLEWGPPASDGGTPILRYEYRLKEGRGEFGEWTPIPDSAPGEVNAAGHTVGELGNGTVYVFELRAVNAAGSGQVSEAVEVRMPLDRAYWSNFLAEDLEGTRLMLEAFLSGGSTGDLELRFGEELRFKESELDGDGEVTATRMGSYGYRYTSRTTGELRLDYDGGESCEVRLTFRGVGVGSYSHRCGGVLGGQGSFELSEVVNQVPEITSTGPFEVAENQARVGQLEAVDQDKQDEITGYGIAGGADGALFAVETGELMFREAPDYEAPSDVESAEPASGAADNEYIVVVEVRSGEGERERRGRRAIRVRVSDEEEPPEITGAGVFEVAENQARVGQLEAVDQDKQDEITEYGIAGGADGALFAVETGELMFREAPDYEAPSDVESAEPASGAADNEYIVVVEVRSGEGERERRGSRAIRVRVADEEEPPEITGAGVFEVAENQAMVGQLEAVDPDKQDEITEYGIAGGADGALFAVETETGELLFREAPDYEDPSDVESAEPESGAADNEYIVVVEVRSGEGERERRGRRAIRVRVSDEEEPPGAPAAPAVTAEGSDSLKVSWREPENRGPEIVDYEVRYRESGEEGYSDGGHEGRGLEVRLSGLEEGTVYEVQVRAVNQEGMSEWSEPGEGRTDTEEADPEDPSDFTEGDLEGRRLTLRLEGEEEAAGSLELRFGEGNRFEQIQSGGQEAATRAEGAARSGSYTYEKTGPGRGTVRLTYDDGSSCEVLLAFTESGAGAFAYDCGGGSPSEGSFRLTTGSLFVPVILSSAGRSNSFFTSELTLTNRGEREVRLDYAYTAHRGGGSGKTSDVLAPGMQKIETDALTYLRGLGVPIPETGNRIGTLRVEARLGSEVEAVVRTTTLVPEGRAGLAYLGVAEEEGFDEPVYLCGLRQNSRDRSNVAFQNMGAEEEGAITVRTTVYSGDVSDTSPRVLEEVTLEPGGFHQYSGLLGRLESVEGNRQGYVKVERVEGRAPFYAYGVINDQANSDGSFVFPVRASSLEGRAGQTLPVVVETSEFTSELTVTNFSEEPRTLDFQFVAEGIETDDKTAAFSMTLEAGRQEIIADVVDELRRQRVAGLGSGSRALAGAVFATAAEGDMSGIVIGARTGSQGGGGSYSVFYNAVPFGEAFSREAWVEGLQQDEENRSNLALVNTGEVDGSPSVFHLEIYDGETGMLAKTVVTKPILARRWHQINGILGSYAPETRQGYIRIEKVSGENPFLAYGVVNDGGAPGERSGDGAYLPAQE